MTENTISAEHRETFEKNAKIIELLQEDRRSNDMHELVILMQAREVLFSSLYESAFEDWKNKLNIRLLEKAIVEKFSHIWLLHHRDMPVHEMTVLLGIWQKVKPFTSKRFAPNPSISKGIEAFCKNIEKDGFQYRGEYADICITGISNAFEEEAEAKEQGSKDEVMVTTVYFIGQFGTTFINAANNEFYGDADHWEQMKIRLSAMLQTSDKTREKIRKFYQDELQKHLVP